MDNADKRWISGVFYSPEDGALPTADPPHLCLHQLPDIALEPTPTQLELTCPDTVPDTMQATATEPFRIWYQLFLYLTPGEYGVYEVDSQMSWHALLGLWSNRLLPKDFELSPDQLQQTIAEVAPQPGFLLAPQPLSASPDFQWPQLPSPGPVMLIRDVQDLWLYEVVDDHKWGTQLHVHDHERKPYQDVMGRIKDTHLIRDHIELTTDIPPVIPHPELANLPGALAEIAIEVSVLQNTDILMLHCVGTPRGKDAFVDLWFSDSMRWWYEHQGRPCHFEDLDDNTWRLEFRPQVGTVATPSKVLLEGLRIRLFQVYLAARSSTDGIHVTLKVDGRPIHVAHHPPEQTFANMFVFMAHVQQLTVAKGHPSLIVNGKACMDPHTMLEIAARHGDPSTFVMHFIPPLRGGDH